MCVKKKCKRIIELMSYRYTNGYTVSLGLGGLANRYYVRLGEVYKYIF